MEEEQIDITTLRYILYARKSTDDPIRQIRSIDDQIAECQALAKRIGIHVIDVIQEKKSAKKPGKRPQFTQMLKDLRGGKYDGILGWNPDRLARNMKEGGEIIDMVDENYIQDMKFVTHHFSKDANGKMLLGMAFVLSKQYSDNLSQNVTRGVRNNFDEGKTPAPKHGYIRDQDGLYRPDSHNFVLIKEAWEMRRNGESFDDIVTFLQKNDYQRLVISSGRQVSITKQMLTKLFRNPFYYGILINGKTGKEIDLRDVYNFEPATTQEAYLEVQQLSNTRVKPYKQTVKSAYLPLKMLVTCSYCNNNHMYPGPSRSRSSKVYLYYRCDNKYCPRKKRSIRGKVIFDFIYKFLDEGFNFTKKDYDKYYGDIIKLTEAKREDLLFEIHSKEGLLKNVKMQVKDISYKLFDEKHPIVKEQNQGRLNEAIDTQQQLEANLVRLKQKITDPEVERITIEQFLNLSENAARVIQSGDTLVKDAISRLIFLNLTVDEEKVASYQLKPPFDELLKTRKVLSSRGKRT